MIAFLFSYLHFYFFVQQHKSADTVILNLFEYAGQSELEATPTPTDNSGAMLSMSSLLLLLTTLFWSN
jgi:hypothetical protein